uniref:Uncharacterized protein n=1 Tax=Arundo donax TaxID=35708 RepID=A0A0A9FT00_ARUDO
MGIIFIPFENNIFTHSRKKEHIH